MRFQLDPRGPGRPRPPAPPPAKAPAPPSTPERSLPPAALPPVPAAAKPAAPPALPRPRTATAAAAKKPAQGSRTRLYAILLVALLVLGGGATAAMYVMELPPFEYPRRYMLEGDEIPPRMRMGDVPPDVASQMGIEENPGQMDEDDVRDLGQFGAPSPEEGWAEVLSPTTSSDPILVSALRFADEDDARSWTSLLSLRCSSVGGALLRDGDVAVVVVAESATAKLYLTRVVDALRSEAPDLQVVCAPGR